MGMLESYVQSISRGWVKYAIILFWTGCLMWGLFYGLGFPRLADNSIPATKGTRAYKAQQLFDDHFPELVNYQPWTLILDSKNGSFLANNQTLSSARSYFEMMNASCTEWLSQNYPHSTSLVVDSQTYFKYIDTDLSPIAKGFASDDGTTMIMALTIDTKVHQSIRYDLYHHVRKMQDILAEQVFGSDWHKQVKVGVTGEDPLADDANAVIISDLEKADMITMPLAFAVLAYMIRSWRLLLISLFNLGVVIVTSFAVMTVVVKNSSFPNQSITPQFMEVMGLAMSIDYSLFMFTRFQTGLRKRLAENLNLDANRYSDKQGLIHRLFFACDLSNDDYESAVVDMLRYSGHVIAMSGTCLIVSFGGFLLLDCMFLETIAIGNIITIGLCIIVSLTSSPAWLFIFPGFFASQDDPKKFFKKHIGVLLPCLRPRGTLSSVPASEQTPLYGAVSESTPLETQSPSPAIFDAQTGSAVDTNVSSTTNNSRSRLLLSAQYTSSSANPNVLAAADMVPMSERPAMNKSYWLRLTRTITRMPYNILLIVLLYVVSGFLAYQVLDIKLTTDFTVGIPHDSPAYTSLVMLRDGFGAGHTQDFYVLQTQILTNKSLVPPPVTSEAFYSAAAIAIQLLTTRTVLRHKDIMSPVVIQVNNVTYANLTWSEASDLLVHNPAYAFGWDELVDATNTSMLHQVITPFDPNTNEVKSFIEDVYKALDDVNEIVKPSGVKFDFCGFKVNEHDTITHAVARFPRMILFTVIVIFVLMAIFLRSMFVPVRLLLTLGVPVAATFGLCVAVYQSGILDWLHIKAIAKTSSGFYWDIPVVAFSIIVGLALDYDVFLITRVVEYRKNGYTGRASVIRAVMDTASIITAAGIIMSLAFSSMLLMSAEAVKQVGWLLTSSVLLDTFVVRTMLVPAVMSIADNISWWPRKMPRPQWNEYGDKAE